VSVVNERKACNTILLDQIYKIMQKIFHQFRKYSNYLSANSVKQSSLISDTRTAIPR
jgi:hypothetical protein